MKRDKHKHFCGFTVSGHAGYNEAGNDVVCSAVSALAQTALLGMLRYSDENQVLYEQKDGFLSAFAVNGNEAIRVILGTMVLGLEQIARQYPEYAELHL